MKTLLPVVNYSGKISRPSHRYFPKYKEEAEEKSCSFYDLT